MDADTYIGYYVSLFIQAHMGIGFLSLFSMFIQLQIGFCTYMNTCADDFKQIINHMNEYLRINGDQRLQTNEIKEHLTEAVRLHGAMLK